MVSFIRILIFLSLLSPLPAIVVGWSRKNLIWWYCLLCLVCDILYIPGFFPGTYRNLLGNLFLIGEGLLLSIYFIRLVSQKTIRNILAGLLSLAFIYFLFQKGVKTSFAILEISTAAPFYMLFVLLSIAGFFQLLIAPIPAKLWRLPAFFLSTGLLFYASGSLCIFLFEKEMIQKNPDFMVNIWGLRNLLNIFKNLCFARALYLLPKT